MAPWGHVNRVKDQMQALLEKLFGLAERRTTVKTELAAGLTTFMTMAYILAVNPSMLSVAGIPRGAVFVATAAAAVVGTLLMAFFANYPFVLAPGMGLNAVLAYGVVIGMGYSWQFALLAVFIEGLVFLALSLTPVRESIFNAIPLSLKKAVAAGLGLFICFIALQTSKIVIDGGPTLVDCVSFRVVPFRTQGVCAALAVLGTILTGVFVARKVKGAMLLGMLSTWALGIAAQSAGVYVPDPEAGYFSLYPEIALSGVSGSFREFGATAGALFDPASWTHGSGEAMRSGWALVRSVDFLVVVFAFFFMDLFDTLGTLYQGGPSRQGRQAPAHHGRALRGCRRDVGRRGARDLDYNYVHGVCRGRRGGRQNGADRRSGRVAFRGGCLLRARLSRRSSVRHCAGPRGRGLHDDLVRGGHRLEGPRRGATSVRRACVDAVYVLDFGRHHVRHNLLHRHQRAGREILAPPLDHVRADGGVPGQVCAHVTHISLGMAG